MLFSELYGIYYRCVTKILEKAVKDKVTDQEIHEIACRYGFSESFLTIESSFKNQKWSLIRPDGTTPVKNAPDMPISLLEKMWLKAILQDKRIRLFDIKIDGLENVEPLFTPDDYIVFDSYSDGDPFDDEKYIHHFRLILSCIKTKCPMRIAVKNRKGLLTETSVIPEYLEYSEKDDKFRLMTSGTRNHTVINLGRIVYCGRLTQNIPKRRSVFSPQRPKDMIRLILTDERNALERVMLHFSHFEKQTVKMDDQHYMLTVYYDKFDETELLIRVLSFGPKIKVIEPESFIRLLKDRLQKQREYLLSEADGFSASSS